MKLQKKFYVVMALLLTFGLVLNSTLAYAASLGDLEKEKKEISNQKSSLNQDINATSNELNKVKEEQNALKLEMQKIDAAMQDIIEKTKSLEKQISKKNEEISELKKEIKVLQKRIEKRDELLKDRARSVQATGGVVSYLEVLLGAKDFSDFINRVSAVTTILKADKSIIEEHKKDRENLEISREKLETDREKLENLKKQNEQQQAALNKKRQEKDNVLAELKDKEAEIQEEYMSLKEEQEVLAAQERSIQRLIEKEKQRIAEEKRKAEEEARKKQQNQGSSGGSGSSGPSQSTSKNGIFIRPINSGIVTSEWAPRWGSFHYGIDIANSIGTPIYAAASGEVSYVGPRGTYGNVVFITHMVNGQIYTTIYAHLSGWNVSAGQYVEQGQRIGSLGNTGRSTGPHLHFEIHEGKYRYGASVNPRKYVNFPPKGTWF
ncbi:murein hydrolase activator EnvC family protein [Bacillus kwashiorkori]|uniref:murein hydrolase activator EnvC family protein n=1 Tax=Bacillus kwashiorkori TaxID=1522318 RepID=UPI000782B982|nr:peptidoglycan DD-metalloendopeptidase family protein [Bacillus kwashiorkori]